MRVKDDAGLDELFVDPAPSKANKRASERRRERGQAPAGPGVPDTATSLKQDKRAKKPSRPPTHGSEVNPRVMARATLTCTRGPEEGLSLNLIEGNYTVGRARENSFVLKDIAASRQHLRIEVDARGARVVDLGSGNGTRVNGKRIAEHALRHGDRIEIGGSVLLFSEIGRPSPKEGAIDDAQERVIRAAEKLAAELSERMRFEDDGASGASFEDGHIARTRAVPNEAKPKAAEQGRRPATKAQQLWKETFTNLPLDQVVPADQPLRGGGPFAAASSRQASADQVSLSAPPQRAPMMRPPPLPLPPQQEEEISLSASRSGGGSQLLSILVTALVVVVVGGGIAVLWMFRGGSGAVAEEQVQHDFALAMRKAELSAAAGDWLTTYEAATMALQLKPNDPIATTYQRDARNRLDRSTSAPAPAPTAPAPNTEPTAPAIPPAPVASAPAPLPIAPAAAAPTAAAPAAPAPTAAAPTPAASPPAPAAAPVAAAPIPPAPPPEVAPPPPSPAPVAKRAPPREAAPKPAPKPKKPRGAMTEAEAQTQFEEAVAALRERNAKKGCAILDEVAAKAPAGSLWKDKADNLRARRCD